VSEPRVHEPQGQAISRRVAALGRSISTRARRHAKRDRERHARGSSFGPGRGAWAGNMCLIILIARGGVLVKHVNKEVTNHASTVTVHLEHLEVQSWYSITTTARSKRSTWRNENHNHIHSTAGIL
jgi:hypothetical protein